LKQLGIEPERIRLEWISAAEGERVRAVVDDMVATLKGLGPVHVARRRGIVLKEAS